MWWHTCSRQVELWSLWEIQVCLLFLFPFSSHKFPVASLPPLSIKIAQSPKNKSCKNCWLLNTTGQAASVILCCRIIFVIKSCSALPCTCLLTLIHPKDSLKVIKERPQNLCPTQFACSNFQLGKWTRCSACFYPEIQSLKKRCNCLMNSIQWLLCYSGWLKMDVSLF